MSTVRRILVVTGARALAVDPTPTAWARRELVRAFAAFSPDLVAHGGAVGPDTWAEELAFFMGLPRVVFGLPRARDVESVASVRCAWERSDRRVINRARVYRFTGPIDRNEAMVRWAADQAAEGHAVRVFGLRAPWASTRGTARTLAAAGLARLDVESVDAPAAAWPAEDPAVEGQHGA